MAQQESLKLIEDLQTQKGLPIEIIYIILRYAYRTQPGELILDIKSYNPEMTYVLSVYHSFFSTDPKEIFNWLLNDIIRYANAGRPTNLGVHPKMLDILSRRFGKHLNTHDECSKFISYYCKVNVESRIRTFWGLFTASERIDFLGEYAYA